MGKLIDLKGKKIGRLTVICRNGSNKKGHPLWLCRCDCGNEKNIIGESLRNNKTKSCGCLRDEKIKKGLTNKHNMSNTRLYRIWNAMKRRCLTKTNDTFEHYGGRGIKICNEWIEDYMNFYNWAINSGYSDELTIDRIEVNGNYEPSNCRWITIQEQQNNKRNNTYIKNYERIQTLKQWSQELNIPYGTLLKRRKLGWDKQDILKPQKRAVKHSNINGVSWEDYKQRWRARITIKGKTIHLGRYKEEKNAIIARLKAEKEYFGIENAPQNYLFERYCI